MGLGDQRLGLSSANPWESDLKRGSDAEPAFRARTDAHCRRDCALGRHLLLLLSCGHLERAEEARGVSRREELLGVVPVASGAAELLRCGQLEIESAVSR